MGGFNPPVPQQDSNWEIRVAVLLSLLFQVLLLFAGPMRKRSSSPVARFAIWSCFLLADWVADLALGLLLNNMGNIGGARSGGSSSPSTASVGGHTSTDSSGNPVIFAFWTPFLLLHLGGQDTITAYSIEDNELWLRHLIGLLFELFSAAVIFCCSLQSNPMILATVLMFVVGITKYGERTYSLYSSSVDGVLADIFGKPDPGPNYAKLMTEFDAKEKAGLAVEIVIADGEAKKVLDALEQNETAWLMEIRNKNVEAKAYFFFRIFRSLCYDVTLSYKERKISLAYFVDREKLTAREAFELMEVELNFLYDRVHTKAPVAHTKAGLVLRFVGSGCLASAVAIFSLLDKDRIQRVDVGITYALLLGGLALDTAALVMHFSSTWTLVFLEKTPRLAWIARAPKLLRPRAQRWSERTLQLNLVSYCLGKPDKTDSFASPRVIRDLAKIADALRVREIFDDFFFIRREPLSCRSKGEVPFLLKFVFKQIRYAATKVKGAKYEEMKGRSSHRGEGAFEAYKEKIVEELLKAWLRGKEGQRLLKAWSRGEEGRRVVRNLDEKIGEEVLKAWLRGEEGDLDEKTVEEVLKAGLTSQGVAGDLEEKIKDIIKESIKDKDQVKGATYDKMKTRNSDRGEAAHEALKEWLDILMSSVTLREFDQSLLLWHIATDLCCLPKAQIVETEIPFNMKSMSKTLSEYMLYLLVRQPKILLASAGVALPRFRDTCAEAQRFFRSAAVWDPDHTDAQRMLLSVNTSKAPREVKGDRSKSVLFDACILAKVLRDLDEETMWEVVGVVWVEMLTYAAGKCRASTHIQQLSRGGELITLVWFLMAHMGLGDMYQNKEADGMAKLIVHSQ